MNKTYRPFTISVQGPHAVGKSTLVEKLAHHYKALYALEAVEALEKYKADQKLDLFHLPDFLRNQKNFINWEVQRYESFLNKSMVFIDRGPDSTELFSFIHPVIMGKDWNVEELLRFELEQLRKCRADIIIYLYAEFKTLHRRASLCSKLRPTMKRWLEVYEPYARKWFSEDLRTYFLNTTGLCSDEVLKNALNLLNPIIHKRLP